MPDPWRLVRRSLVRDFRVVTAYAAVFADPRDGSEHDRVILGSPDWINVLAITPADEAVLVRQFRFGVGATSLETPGGLLDDGEEPAACAARELEEETGYRARSLRPLGWIHPNPALQTNRAHLFLALGCERAHAGRPDRTEDIAVELHPRERLRALVEAREITHAITVAACYLAEPLLAAR
ncbi:MAG TPA: NUDIX hydrolase [Candidatus Limnocylindria bacterium]|nr:NUDIX hydrolase [Candidatus Limnocylindria bacterium]